MTIDLDAFFAGFIASGLWAENANLPGAADNDDTSFHTAGFSQKDLTPKARTRLRQDCADFIAQHEADLAEFMRRTQRPADHLGYDFWLTRNGHGAGFWDRVGGGESGQRLTKACGYGTPFPPVDLYVGYDGQLHVG